MEEQSIQAKKLLTY